MQFHHSKQIYVFLPWLKYFAKYTNLQQDLVQYKTYINALNKYIHPAYYSEHRKQRKKEIPRQYVYKVVEYLYQRSNS